jgi:hypothetical protein
MAGHHYNDPHLNPERFRRFLIEQWFRSEQVYMMLYYRSEVRVKLRIGDFKQEELYLLDNITNLFEKINVRKLPRWRALLQRTTKHHKGVCNAERINQICNKGSHSIGSSLAFEESGYEQGVKS